MFTFLYFAVNIYVFIRGWQALPGKTGLRLLYSAVFVTALASYIVGVYFYQILPEKLILPSKLINRFWLAWVMFFSLGALFADFLRMLNHFRKIFPSWLTANYPKVKFIYMLILLLSVIIISFIGFRQYDDPQIVKLDLPLSNNCGSLNDLKIVAVSDLHLSPLIHEDKLAEWVIMINELDPDIILLAGDIFSYNFNPNDSRGVILEFRKLRSKYGVYAVPGNHDFSFGIIRSAEYLERAGIVVLRDSSVTIDNRFILTGRDDFKNHRRKSLDLLLNEIEPCLPVILLDHQPVDLHGSAKNGIFLQISGHTHNGQIFPVNYLYSLKWELVYGYRKIDNTHFYVTSGLGFVHTPIRLGTRSEIVLIKVTQ